MARQIAEKEEISLTPEEAEQFDFLLNFTMFPPFSVVESPFSIKYEQPKSVCSDFPVLSTCVLTLCEIATKRSIYSLEICGYVVNYRKQCKKIVVQRTRGRKKLRCASHRTEASRRKKSEGAITLVCLCNSAPIDSSGRIHCPVHGNLQ